MEYGGLLRKRTQITMRSINRHRYQNRTSKTHFIHNIEMTAKNQYNRKQKTMSMAHKVQFDLNI